jgi:hypothetical protein
MVHKVLLGNWTGNAVVMEAAKNIQDERASPAITDILLQRAVYLFIAQGMGIYVIV